MSIFNFLSFIAITLLIVGCGHKKTIQPPPPPKVAESLKNKTSSVQSLPQGNGGYMVADSGLIVLYWDFPSKVDYSLIYKGSTLLGRTDGYTFLVKETIEKPTTFRVIGIKNNRKVGEVLIKVSP